MLVKTGLLIVTNPKQIGQILPSIQKNVKNTLYIQLLSAITGEPFGNVYTNTYTSWPKFRHTIYGIYSEAATHCKDLDVRVLLSGLKYKSLKKIKTNKQIDLVIFDKIFSSDEIDCFVKGNIGSVIQEYNTLTFDSGNYDPVEIGKDAPLSKHAVLGGTFDRLHIAHKMLLTEAALLSSQTVTVGVTEESMCKSKVLWELNEDIEKRMSHVTDFLEDICSELELKVVPISDPFGPAITDPSMDIIVVSEETVRGGQKINEIRKEKGLNQLEIVTIPLLDEPNRSLNEEAKISSSNGRIRLLGTLLQPVKPNENIPRKPYIIGLTGGVATGKSGVAKWMQENGAETINCDLVGHNVYRKGKPCYDEIVKHFGEKVVGEDGEINRPILGSIVFGNPSELEQLNLLVWPAIMQEVSELIKVSKSDVIVIEAAVLLTANWHKNCHEIWSTLVPKAEQIKRLQTRNNLTEAQAQSRVDAQPTNSYYVKHSNVVFCPLWTVEFTKEQVDRAWLLLQERISQL